MSELIVNTKNIRIEKLPKSDAAERMAMENSGRLVRLYCQQYAESWNLQIFGPLGVGFAGMKDGKDYVIARATLSRADLLALRIAITAALGEK